MLDFGISHIDRVITYPIQYLNHSSEHSHITLVGFIFSLYELLTKHSLFLSLSLGSVCLGSMILSIVMLVKFFVELFYREMKKNARGNAAANCCVRCCVCCLRCFENFIRFVNTNAYIMIGLTGNSFCGSAKQAFFLFLRNAA